MRALLYLLQVIAFSGGFLLVFRLFLSRLPVHRFNRCFLLATSLLSLTLPLVRIPLPERALPAAMARFSLNDIVVGIQPQAKAHTGIDWYLLAGGAYLLITFLLLIGLMRRHLKLAALLRQAPLIAHDSDSLRLTEGLGPGSYNGIIFFPDPAIDASMLRHEQAHIRYRHQLDVWWMQLLKCLFWINPVFYFLDAQLRLVHEYEADEAAGRGAFADYAELLLAHVLGTRSLSLAHSFFHHPIKNRILMLQQSNPRRRHTFRKFAAIGLLAIGSAGILTAQIVKHGASTAESRDDVPETPIRDAQIKPSFKGDVNAWLSAHLKYPDAVRKKGQEGRVIIKFVVNRDGHISDEKIVRSSNVPELDAEAVRVIHQMPDWNPGRKNGRRVRISFYLPITFRLA